MSKHITHVTLTTSHLAALLHIAPKKDIRSYLNGVCVEVKGGKVRLIATNGNAMGITKNDHYSSGEGEIIIGYEDVKTLIKNAGKLPLIQLDFLSEENEVTYLTYRVHGTNEIFRPLEGKFPDWRRVFPNDAGEDLHHVQIDPALLIKFCKAAADLGDRGQRINVMGRGNKVAMVTLPRCSDFVGLVMPLNTGNYESKLVGELHAEFC